VAQTLSGLPGLLTEGRGYLQQLVGHATRRGRLATTRWAAISLHLVDEHDSVFELGES
jgi:hypothetical protein